MHKINLAENIYRFYVYKKNKYSPYYDKKYYESLKKYHNIHAGERCFILGNGPSINRVDFSSLSKEYTFSVNQLSRNENFGKLKTNYHLWTDRLFFEIDENDEGDMQLLSTMKKVRTDDNNPIVFYEMMARPMIERYKLTDCLNIECFKAISMNMNVTLKGDPDFSRPIPNFPTVVHTAIYLAVYRGFTEIYLLGCDCTGFLNIAKNRMKEGNEVQYGYTISNIERARMEKMANKRTISEELASFVVLFDLYEKLYNYCNAQGVSLFNATDGGLLDSIPRVDIKDILK